MTDVKIIVALGKDGAIGRNGDLIWKIPDDLKRFKALTTGHPVIMGRKTWESLPKKPLPGRRNIVLTRQKDFEAPGAEISATMEEALTMTQNESPFIIGGAQIYEEFLPLASELYLTEVEEECEEADAFLHIDFSKWQLMEESEVFTTESGVRYRYRRYCPTPALH